MKHKFRAVRRPRSKAPMYSAIQRAYDRLCVTRYIQSFEISQTYASEVLGVNSALQIRKWLSDFFEYADLDLRIAITRTHGHYLIELYNEFTIDSREDASVDNVLISMATNEYAARIKRPADYPFDDDYEPSV